MNMMAQTHLFEALTEAGFKPEHARRVEREVDASILAGHESIRAELSDKLAHKSDLLETRAALKSDIQAVRTELKTEIQAVRTELKTEIQTVRTEIQEVRTDLLKAMNEQTWRLVSFVVVANGAMLAAFKLLG
jgi:chromosome segregation ATPase